MSSVAGHKVRPGGAVYAATKHAVRVHLGRAAAGSEAVQHPHDDDLAGAVATELPDSITEPDVAAGIREIYEGCDSGGIVRAQVAFAMSQPEDVDINEILFRPTRQEL